MLSVARPVLLLARARCSHTDSHSVGRPLIMLDHFTILLRPSAQPPSSLPRTTCVHLFAIRFNHLQPPRGERQLYHKRSRRRPYYIITSASTTIIHVSCKLFQNSFMAASRLARLLSAMIVTLPSCCNRVNLGLSQGYIFVLPMIALAQDSHNAFRSEDPLKCAACSVLSRPLPNS